jgi:hypothetical protein
MRNEANINGPVYETITAIKPLPEQMTFIKGDPFKLAD